jgi:hypothetical protein
LGQNLFAKPEVLGGCLFSLIATSPAGNIVQGNNHLRWRGGFGTTGTLAPGIDRIINAENLIDPPIIIKTAHGQTDIRLPGYSTYCIHSSIAMVLKE